FVLPCYFTVSPRPVVYTLSLHDALPISRRGREAPASLPRGHARSRGRRATRAPRRSGPRARRRSGFRFPGIELARLRILGRLPTLGLVRCDVLVELAADVAEEQLGTDLVDRELEIRVRLHVVDVDVVEDEETAVLHAGELGQFRAVRFGEYLRDLFLR